MGDSLAGFFDDPQLGELGLIGPPSSEDLFSFFEALEGIPDANPAELDQLELELELEGEGEGEPDIRKRKRQKVMIMGDQADQLADNHVNINNNSNTMSAAGAGAGGDGQINRMSHITVERNRRKQMNDNLSVLRSLMPCFYVKRGDQASIIGGVVDYINELQQVLQSLEAKKQRKVYSEVLSPRLVSSPRPSPKVLSPRNKPPLSPRLSQQLPISPRTPQPGSPYIPSRLPLPVQAAAAGAGAGYQHHLSSPTKANYPLDLSPCSSSTSSIDNINNINNINVINDLVANSKSSMAEVEVKFSGANLLLKTVSPRIPGQVVKIIAALEDLSLQILHLNISTMDDTMHHSFTIKIGIECQLSAEDLAHQIQQTFC
ncbi:hypothetical protein Dimus_000178 [Dionaea muscipula]